jgi:deazaflavin-dependent oxidoreductase (nitroreductase family)
MLFGQEHVDRYQATDGEEGHEWQGTTALLLTTTGRKSGEERTTPLIYQEHNGGYLVVASKGGADEPPAWFRNLEANPTVGVRERRDSNPRPPA